MLFYRIGSYGLNLSYLANDDHIVYTIVILFHPYKPQPVTAQTENICVCLL